MFRKGEQFSAAFIAEMISNMLNAYMETKLEHIIYSETCLQLTPFLL